MAIEYEDTCSRCIGKPALIQIIGSGGCYMCGGEVNLCRKCAEKEIARIQEYLKKKRQKLYTYK